MHGDVAIEGASDFLFTLKKKRVPFYIVANNTTESSNQILLKLKSAGCAVAHDQLITASQVGIAYAVREGIASVAFIGSDEQKKEWQEAGITVTTEKPQAVCIALDTHLSYETLTATMRLLHTNTRYFALSDSPFHITDAGVSPGIGATLSFLEEVTGRTPDAIFGKPGTYMMEYITERVGVPATRMGIVGDQMSVDMNMAENYGMVSTLVLSGQSSRENVREHQYQPDYIVESVTSLVPLFQ